VTRPRVFIARRIPDEGIAPIEQVADTTVWPDELPPPRDKLLEAVAGCDAVLTLLTDRVDDEFLDAAGTQLKVVSNYAVGFDNVDVPACTRRGIPVGNTPGVLTDTTADLAVALMLGIGRRLAQGDAYVRRGEWKTWETQLLLGHDLHEATVGIVGFGRIGQAVARRVSGFDCEVLHTSRSGGVSLEELLERSDFVSVHTPLTPETRGLIDADALRRMKPSAYLVNTARGPVVDSAALVEALGAGEIAGAALDVTDPEPLPAGDPLLDAPNLLVLPHLGSATHATRERMADMAVDNLLAGLRGEPMPNSVT